MGTQVFLHFHVTVPHGVHLLMHGGSTRRELIRALRRSPSRMSPPLFERGAASQDVSLRRTCSSTRAVTRHNQRREAHAIGAVDLSPPPNQEFQDIQVPLA